MNPAQIFGPAAGIVGGALRLGGRAMGSAVGLVRRAIGQAPSSGDDGGQAAEGTRQEAAPSQRRRPASPPKELDDATLARKVESIVFRGEDAPKGSVDVNVVDGVVWLRGQVKRPEQVRALEAAVTAIPEVRGVENLLHLPKTPAPTRADTPRSQQRTRSSSGTARPRRSARVSGDRSTAGRKPEGAEPSPREVAADGSGRKPAPMGSQDASDEFSPDAGRSNGQA